MVERYRCWSRLPRPYECRSGVAAGEAHMLERRGAPAVDPPSCLLSPGRDDDGGCWLRELGDHHYSDERIRYGLL